MDFETSETTTRLRKACNLGGIHWKCDVQLFLSDFCFDGPA